MKYTLARFVIYTLLVFGLTASLPVIIKNGDVLVFSEDGPIEWCQFILLTASAAILLFFSRAKTCRLRELFCVLALTAVLASIRELDKIFDELIPVAGWKLPAALCVAGGFFIYWKKRDIIITQSASFISTSAFPLMWCGFIIAIPFAQLVGHGAFMRLLMGDDYVRDYKRVIEELGELLGYLLIFIGSIEAILQQKNETNGAAVKNGDGI
jgi:hypothetical protein